MEQRRPTNEDGAGSSRPVSNVFGDEFEVLDIAPADGFRPTDDRASIRSFTPSEPYSFASSSRIQSAAAHIAPDSRMAMAPPLSRNSTRKSMSQQNPFSSEQDEAEGSETPLARSPSIQSANFAPGARRSISSASSRQYAGGAGPSHPYTMYPQGTMIRTASAATNTVTRTSGSRAGPAHPYGLYTQGITHSDDEGDDDAEDASNPVPVGFGLGQPYRRVRGPEGEEQDIIGDYGHAEQLPPYSRYADDEQTKLPIITEPEPLHSRSPIEGTDPGMPLMHQRMSQAQSMTDASQLESSQPLLAEASSTTEASSLGKKSWAEKSWQERKKTKILGIKFSYWLIALALTTLLFAALIGSLVGYLAGSKHKSPASTETTASQYDASLIPTPAGAIPSGSQALFLGQAEATQANCLTNPAQRAAWDCRLAGKPALAITIGLPPVPAPTIGALLFYASGDNNISYGSQYSAISGNQLNNMISVRDNDNSSLGPAFYFQQIYNKIVVVEEAALSPVPQKRWWQDAHPANKEPIEWERHWSQKQKANIGDKPWFCVFNNTLLEGYMYVSKPAVLPSSSSWRPSTTSSTSCTTTSATSSTVASNPYARPTSDGDRQGQPTSLPPWMYSVSADRAQTTPALAVREYPARPTDENAFPAMSVMPYVFKLEERRLPGSPPPYCQQFQILNDRKANWVADSNGQPIKIFLTEQSPEYTAYVSAAPSGVTKRNEAGACHCQWLHGAPPT